MATPPFSAQLDRVGLRGIGMDTISPLAKTIPEALLRVSKQREIEGLDLSQHGEALQ